MTPPLRNFSKKKVNFWVDGHPLLEWIDDRIEQARCTTIQLTVNLHSPLWWCHIVQCVLCTHLPTEVSLLTYKGDHTLMKPPILILALNKGLLCVPFSIGWEEQMKREHLLVSVRFQMHMQMSGLLTLMRSFSGFLSPMKCSVQSDAVWCSVHYCNHCGLEPIT